MLSAKLGRSPSLNGMGRAMWRDSKSPSEARKEPRLSPREAGGQNSRKVHNQFVFKLRAQMAGIALPTNQQIQQVRQ